VRRTVATRLRGSASLAWLGTLPQAVAFQRRPLATLRRYARSGGEGFTLATLAAGRTWVVATPELAHDVLHAEHGLYRAGAANRRILPVLPDCTLLTLDGEAHRARRRVLAPLFHGDSLETTATFIRGVARVEMQRWPIGRPFAVLPRMRFMTLQVAARLVLGVEDPALVRELERHLSDALRPYAMLARLQRLAVLGAASPQAQAVRCRAGFAGGLNQVWAARPYAPVDGPPNAVDLLRAAADDAEIADEAFALLLAGHETTSSALAWAVEMLAHEPAATAALAREGANGGSRPLLDAVIFEILRLRPPLVDIVRELSEPARLGTRDLAAGTLVLISPPLIHDHTRPSPEAFMADRFLARRPDPLTWLPFGGGERRCLGASLALLELREILAQLVDRFELTPADEQREDARLHGTALVPARGARVVLRPR